MAIYDMEEAIGSIGELLVFTSKLLTESGLNWESIKDDKDSEGKSDYDRIIRMRELLTETMKHADNLVAG